MSTHNIISWFVLMIAASGASAVGAVIQVPADFATIQQAIDAAVAGDVIVVSPGTYLENIDFNGKAVTLRSTDPLDPAVVAATIIDANGAGTVVTCMSNEGADTVLNGFTITGGNSNNGGGMLNNRGSPTVTNCRFIGNRANDGAAITNVESSPTVTNCVFVGNEAFSTGGAFRNFSNSNPTVTHCRFIGNTARGSGAIENISGSHPTLINCAFIGNSATGDPGGAISNFGSNPTLINCVFVGNTASFDGGAIYNLGSNPTITNCSFSRNTSGNIGGGIMNISSSSTLTNCILWGNVPEDMFTDSGVPLIAHSNIGGSGGSGAWDASLGTDGGGNIDLDPMFVDADGADNIVGTEDDDLRLLESSPSIDTGSNAAPGLTGIQTDLDGNARFFDAPVSPNCPFAPGTCGVSPIVDMGPYEFIDLRPVPAASPWGLIATAVFLSVTGAILLRRYCRTTLLVRGS